MLVKSYSISPVRLQRIVVKALFLRFCKVSIDHLFDNLESGKKMLFWKKSWILDPEIGTNPDNSGTSSFHLNIFLCICLHDTETTFCSRTGYSGIIVFIPVFNPNEILVLVWDFILVSCKMKEDFVLNWNRKPSSLGQVAHAYLIWR